MSMTQTGPIVGLLLVLLSVAVLTFYSRRLATQMVDQVLALGLLAWTAFLVWQPRFGSQPVSASDEFIEHMAFQLCVAAACRLALSGMNAGHSVTLPVGLFQFVGGGGLLLLWTSTGEAQWMDLWEACNSAIIIVIALALCWRWWEGRGRRRRSHGIPALSLVLLFFSATPDYWHHPSTLWGMAGLFVYPAALIGLWNMVTAQMRRSRSRGQKQAHQDASERERQRIAQEVHDGVGSQLVAILSSLDSRDPQQQALALALERCLLELKITVDSLQPAEPDLLEGLGMLRYRLQPSLDRMQCKLLWHVEPHAACDALPPLMVTHALRIAQEAVANALRHAQCRHLTVSCGYDPTRSVVLMAIADDGKGMSLDAGGMRGRGLKGMVRRAAEAGMVLQIETSPGEGCRVCLAIPAPDEPRVPQPAEPDSSIAALA